MNNVDYQFAFNVKAFLESLPYMLIGMVGIFFIIGLLVCTLVLYTKIFPAKKEDE
jgi:uncharacterized membrane protein